MPWFRHVQSFDGLDLSGILDGLDLSGILDGLDLSGALMVWACLELWWFEPVRNFSFLSGALWVWHSGLELMILSLDGEDPRASVILG